jgi:hypothetical protein
VLQSPRQVEEARRLFTFHDTREMNLKIIFYNPQFLTRNGISFHGLYFSLALNKLSNILFRLLQHFPYVKVIFADPRFLPLLNAGTLGEGVLVDDGILTIKLLTENCLMDRYGLSFQRLSYFSSYEKFLMPKHAVRLPYRREIRLIQQGPRENIVLLLGQPIYGEVLSRDSYIDHFVSAVSFCGTSGGAKIEYKPHWREDLHEVYLICGAIERQAGVLCRPNVSEADDMLSEKYSNLTIITHYSSLAIDFGILHPRIKLYYNKHLLENDNERIWMIEIFEKVGAVSLSTFKDSTLTVNA